MIDALIAHGHSELQCLQLKNWLRSVNINGILIEEEDDLGLSILDKFEHYARQCDLAFVVFTPNVAVVEKGSEPKQASRPDVMIELGWLLRHCGRQRVILVQQADMILPSDIGGILRLTFSISILECTEQIRRRLRGIGLP